MFFSFFLYLCTWQSNSRSLHLSPSSNLRRNYGAICVRVRKLSLCNHELLSQQNRLHHSPNQFEMHTIMHGTRAQQLIMPFQILLRPGHQIRRQTAFTLNNWDYPASPSDVTARRNTLKTSENAHRLTSRQRNILLKCVCVCVFELMFKGTVQYFGQFCTPSLKTHGKRNPTTQKRFSGQVVTCTFTMLWNNDALLWVGTTFQTYLVGCGISEAYI